MKRTWLPWILTAGFAVAFGIVLIVLVTGRSSNNVDGVVQDNSGRLDQAKLSLLARSQWPFMGERQQIARPSEP